MSDNHVSRRAVLATAGAAPLAAATRTPVVVSNYPQVAVPPSADPIKVVTTYKFDPHEIEKITSGSPVKVEIQMCSSQEEFRLKLREAEVVYGGVRAADLDYAPKLKWVQSGGAGVEGMEDKVRKHPFVMTNYARTFAPGISETAMGLLLCLTRGIAKYYMPQFYRDKTMKPAGTVKSDHHTELVGRTMGIVGMGGIGTALARRAHYGFDMRIIGIDAKPLPKPDFVSELHDPSYFMKMVPQVDVLVAAAPHTPKTNKMFNEQVFRSMKKTAHFLAMSRGGLFDDMALVRALKEGWIAGAGLDVMPKEPPPAGHPIFECPNVVMSAHSSGWSPDRQVRLIDLFADNVRRYAMGLPLINVVDKEAGY
ncbi:MAG: D-2-hydroxyacid dehydrogenase [Acidobacteriia bacterium]|nr:D-2-hydroxyacid dehydrogenase [Terriglobia bacterium]